jgi:peptidoglycan hydrolase-like protein with peptidoglycan-binding domain
VHDVKDERERRDEDAVSVVASPPRPEAGRLGLQAVLSLQRTAGNAAVARMFSGGSTGTAQAARPRLHAGSHGASVRTLQARLNQTGAAPPLKVDGVFGPRTVLAVRRFQKAHGLRGDGLVGTKTWMQLEGALEQPPAPDRSAPPSDASADEAPADTASDFSEDEAAYEDEALDEQASPGQQGFQPPAWMQQLFTPQQQAMPPQQLQGFMPPVAPAPRAGGNEYTNLTKKLPALDPPGGGSAGGLMAPGAPPEPVDKWKADLKVQSHYLGDASKPGESVDSGSVVKQMLAAAAGGVAQDPSTNFRDLFKIHYKWTDADLNKYIDQSGAAVNSGAVPHVEYLGADERKPYEVTGGSPLVWGNREPTTVVDTGTMSSKAEGAGYAIFAMDGSGKLYFGSHKIALFHHSSFLAAAGAAAAGGIKVTNGVVKAVTNHSGHYQPTPKHVLNIVGELLDRGATLDRNISVDLGDDLGQCSLEDFLKQYRPEWLPRIGVQSANGGSGQD